jgi:hypothetical protein
MGMHMKITIAIAFALALITIAIGLHVTKRIGEKALTILLGTAIVGAFVAANYDVITKLTGPGGLSVETIQEARDNALEDIKKEVNGQKERLDLVIASANEARTKLEQRESTISALIDDASKTRERLQQTIEMAKPPVLSLKGDPSTIRRGDAYEVSFLFLQSKLVPPGVVAFLVRANPGEDAKIVSLEVNAGILIGQQKNEITEGGKVARVIYQPIGATQHRLKLVVSGPLSVEISGTHMEKRVEYSIGK